MDIRYLQRYEFVCEDNPYQKEACDVRTQCSIIFPLSSTQYFLSGGQRRSHRSSYQGKGGLTVQAGVSGLRQPGLRCSQLHKPQNPGSEHGNGYRLDHLRLPQGILSALPWYPHRAPRAFSPISAGSHPFGSIDLSTMPGDDRNRIRKAPGPELENG